MYVGNYFALIYFIVWFIMWRNNMQVYLVIACIQEVKEKKQNSTQQRRTYH